MIRAVVRAQSVIRHDPSRATRLRPAIPGCRSELIGQILARDAEFYQPSISMEAIREMNRFATAVGRRLRFRTSTSLLRNFEAYGLLDLTFENRRTNMLLIE